MDDSTLAPGIHDPAGLKALARNIEFRNHVLLRAANRKELLAHYKEADKLAYSLVAILRNARDSYPY
jgi:hypothetical protein